MMQEPASLEAGSTAPGRDRLLAVMGGRSSLVLNVSDLARPSARPRRVECHAAVTWELELSRIVPEPPLEVKLVLSPVSGGIIVRGDTTAHVEHTCPRCLERRIEQQTIEVAQLYSAPGVDDEADYEIGGDEIDLEPMLRDEILLAMPLLPVCGDACAGLVGGPETGLNTPSPGDDGVATSPFAVLKDLFDAGEVT